MLTDDIRKYLFEQQDIKYRDFQMKLIPTVDPDTAIGVRTPALRKYARQLMKEPDLSEFLNDLPHPYFDENQLHAFVVSSMKDYDRCMVELERFLPYVDNWATCDQMSPKIFKKHRAKLAEKIKEWIGSEESYTVRFGVGMLMEHFLDEDFDPAFPEMVARIRSEEYYVNMMIAWYFATALAKQYEAVLPYIEEKRLDEWCHNMTIRKCVESNRISKEQKDYLKTFRIKKR